MRNLPPESSTTTSWKLVDSGIRFHPKVASVTKRGIDPAGKRASDFLTSHPLDRVLSTAIAMEEGRSKKKDHSRSRGKNGKGCETLKELWILI